MIFGFLSFFTNSKADGNKDPVQILPFTPPTKNHSDSNQDPIVKLPPGPIVPLKREDWQHEQIFVARDGQPFDHFGHFIACDKKTVYIGTNKLDENSNKIYVDSLKSSVIISENVTKQIFYWDEIKQISSHQRSDSFGSSITAYNGTVFIGASTDSSRGRQSGVVYIYKDSSKKIISKSKIIQSKIIIPHANFGTSLSADEDLLLIGAKGEHIRDGKNTGPHDIENTGAVYLFKYDATSDQYIQMSRTTAFQGGFYSDYGHLVSICNGTIAVAAQADSDKVSLGGAVFIYSYSTVTYEMYLSTVLAPEDLQEYAYFGYNMFVTDKLAVIAAYVTSDDGETASCVYVFHKLLHEYTSIYESITTGIGDEIQLIETRLYAWKQIAKLFSPAGFVDDMYASALTIYNNEIIVIGAPGDEYSNIAGCVYLYGEYKTTVDKSKSKSKTTTSTEAFSVIVKMKSYDNSGFSGYGGSVAVFGDSLLVGAENRNSPGGNKTGAVYYEKDLFLYIRNGSRYIGGNDDDDTASHSVKEEKKSHFREASITLAMFIFLPTIALALASVVLVKNSTMAATSSSFSLSLPDSSHSASSVVAVYPPQKYSQKVIDINKHTINPLVPEQRLQSMSVNHSNPNQQGGHAPSTVSSLLSYITAKSNPQNPHQLIHNDDDTFDIDDDLEGQEVGGQCKSPNNTGFTSDESFTRKRSQSMSNLPTQRPWGLVADWLQYGYNVISAAKSSPVVDGDVDNKTEKYIPLNTLSTNDVTENSQHTHNHQRSKSTSVMDEHRHWTKDNNLMTTNMEKQPQRGSLPLKTIGAEVNMKGNGSELSITRTELMRDDRQDK